jgi:dTDP-glucose pyrophosphorylase
MLNIIIPMAGRGSRFASAGYADPKPLIPVHDMRMIELVIHNLTPNEPHRFIFICQTEHVLRYQLNPKLAAWAPGCEVVAIDGVTDGAACTVLHAKALIDNDEPLMIANSDQYVDCSIDAYLAAIADNDGVIMTMTADDPKWSFVGLGSSGTVERVVEKQVISNEATVGIYNFRSGRDFVSAAEEMIQRGDRVNGEYYVAPVYNYQIKRGASIAIYNIGEEGAGMYGLGVPDDLSLFLSLPVSDVARISSK